MRTIALFKRLFVMLVIMLIEVMSQGEDQAFNDKKTLQLTESYSIAWMKNLDDNKLISGITIPGTHDTMALHGGPAAECQAWELKDQLRAGIRYLDLRVFALENTLYIMHGVIYQHSHFSVVFDTVRTFLAEFPSETVLMRVKPDLIDKEKVQELVLKFIGSDTDVWVTSDIPTMGKARGKIIFVQKSSFTLGVPLLGTDRKDDYEVTNIADKEDKIVQHLTQASIDCGSNSIVLSYSSGTGIGTLKAMFLTPKKVAEKIDPWFMQHLITFSTENPKPCYGVIAMDFPGVGLIQTVIKLNGK